MPFTELIADPARALWDRLAAGTWTVDDRRDTEEVRYLLIAPVSSAMVLHHRLSRREREVIELAESGEPMKNIGFALGISEATATSYFACARMKTGFASRQELIFWANRLKTGIVSVTREDGTWTLVTPAVAPADTPLSKAEHEVVARAAAGLSNAQIAASRGVSARTVANQLASAFRKLGVASRFELGCWSARASLT